MSKVLFELGALVLTGLAYGKVKSQGPRLGGAKSVKVPEGAALLGMGYDPTGYGAGALAQGTPGKPEGTATMAASGPPQATQTATALASAPLDPNFAHLVHADPGNPPPGATVGPRPGASSSVTLYGNGGAGAAVAPHLGMGTFIPAGPVNVTPLIGTTPPRPPWAPRP